MSRVLTPLSDSLTLNTVIQDQRPDPAHADRILCLGYGSDSHNYLSTVGLLYPDHPVLLQHFDLGGIAQYGYARWVFKSGTNVYVAFGDGVLRIYSQADNLATPPVLAGQRYLGDIASIATVSPNLLVALIPRADDSWITDLVVYSLSGTSLTLLGSLTYTTEWFGDVVAVPGQPMVYLVGFNGLHVVDLSNPATPMEKATYCTENSPNYRYALSRSRSFVSMVAGEAGYYTFSNPFYPAGVGDGPSAAVIHGLRVAPNPARGPVQIAFEARSSAPAHVRILDVAGRRVREFDVAADGAGRREMLWDGRDGAGSLVVSGVYAVAVEAGEESWRARVVVLK